MNPNQKNRAEATAIDGKGIVKLKTIKFIDVERSTHIVEDEIELTPEQASELIRQLNIAISMSRRLT